MDDMHAFERQVDGQVNRWVGPPRPVDDAAIFTAISTARSPRWRFQPMFSATRFVLATAIVALFGGLLLTGVMITPRSDDTAPAAVTASPSPVTTQDLLSSLVTEEVEPGVFRVLDDGAGHDLVAEPPAGLTIAPDGSVWLLRAAPDFGVDAVYELGRDGTFPFSAATNPQEPDLAVGGDGVAWLNAGLDKGGGRLAAFDGAAWSSPTWPGGAEGVGAIEATADGAVWVIEEPFAPGSRVARIVDGEWTVLPPLDDPSLAGFFDGEGPCCPLSERVFRPDYLAASADSEVWLASGGHQGDSALDRYASPDGLLHFDGTRWEVVDLPPGGSGAIRNDGSTRTIEGWLAGPLALGTDGTLWVYLEQPGTREVAKTNDPVAGYLARLDADGWTLFSATADDVPKLVLLWGPEAAMAVDATGTLWIGHFRDGILAFDGSEWRRYLDGLDVNGIDVAPDGSVFATGVSGCDPTAAESSGFCQDRDRDLERAGLYVVTPEAMTAAE